jgi:glyoxylase-like metal-dependent hydrolase (beta-lactamase superfamily II)
MTDHRYTGRDDWFTMEQVGEGIHRLIETWYRDDYRCNIYVIQGERRDLVIDTGLGLAPLRPSVEALAPDPLLVSSHGHYDHIGGNFEFAERLIHRAEADIVAHPTRENTLADRLLATEDFRALPWDGFRAEDWAAEPAPATGLIGEGDVLDLGDRRLTVLHTPGHSWGSVCLWDEARGDLFCADTVYAGELFDRLPCSDVATYVRSLRRLRDHPVRTAYPGHGPVLDGSAFRAVIDDYLALRA